MTDDMPFSLWFCVIYGKTSTTRRRVLCEVVGNIFYDFSGRPATQSER